MISLSNFFLSLSLIPSHLLADLSEKRKVRLLRLQFFLWVNVVISSTGRPLWKFVRDNCIGFVSTKSASAGGRLRFPWVSFRFPWVGNPIPNHGTFGEERPLSPAHLTGRIVDNRRNAMAFIEGMTVAIIAPAAARSLSTWPQAAMVRHDDAAGS